MEVDIIFFENCLLDMITKSKDILPSSFLIIDKKVSMSLTHMDATNSHAFESSIIDELPCTERPYISFFTDKTLFSTDPLMEFFHFRILEKWSTWKSWWLLESTKCLEISRSIRLVFICSFRWYIEKHIDHKKSFITLQDTLTIIIVEIFIGECFCLSCMEIEYICLDEKIGHLETKTPSISDTSSSHCSRKSYPRNQSRNTIVLIQFCRKCRRDFSALDSNVFSSITIVWLSISSETIVYKYPFEYIKSKKTICPSSYNNNWKSRLFRECKKLWKDHDIIDCDNIKQISCYRFCLEGWEKRNVGIFLEKIWCLHISMIIRRKGKSRNFLIPYFFSFSTGSYHPFDHGLQRRILQNPFPIQMMIHFFSIDSIA